MTSGILVINKPGGLTSHDVVDRIRRITGVRRVGHAGTLDPLATGLLIILVGEATKRQAEFMAGEKEYRAVLRLGATSDTDDAEGRIAISKSEFLISKQTPISKSKIQSVLKKFIGEVEQVPPAYSAIKIRGKKAYELARKGKIPELKARSITIKEIELLEYVWPNLRIGVVCSPGTYIRALARDIGKILGRGAYLEALTRTRSGEFTLQDAIALKDLTEENWKHYRDSTA